MRNKMLLKMHLTSQATGVMNTTWKTGTLIASVITLGNTNFIYVDIQMQHTILCDNFNDLIF